MIREKSFYKTLFRLALPSAFQSFLSLLVVMADNIMISRFDPENALAAVSQVNSVSTFVISMLMGIGAGGIVLISQYWGKRNKAAIKPICGMVCLFSMLLSLIVITLVLSMPRTVLSLVLDPKETVLTDIAVRYFRIVCLSYLFTAITGSLVSVLKGVEVVRMTLYATILSLITNISLNYILIFGKLGLPSLGVEGAAIATVIARIVEMTTVMVYCFKVQKNADLRVGDMFRTKAWAVKDYFRFGAPIALGDTQWALVGMLKAAMIGYLGKTMISAMNITDTMANLATMFTFAMADAACVVIGKSVGAGNYDRTRKESNTIQVLFALFGFVMCTLVFLVRKPFISLYGASEDISSLAAQLVAIAAVTLLGTTYHAACFRGINRGSGDGNFVVIVDLICGWLIVLPLTFLCAFVFDAPLPVIFLCTRIDQCFKWLIAFLRLKGNRWIRNVTRDKVEAA